MRAASICLAVLVLLAGCASDAATSRQASIAPLDEAARAGIVSLQITPVLGERGDLHRLYEGWKWNRSRELGPLYGLGPAWDMGIFLSVLGEEMARAPELRIAGSAVRPVMADRSGSEELKAAIAERIVASGRYPIQESGAAAELLVAVDGPSLVAVPFKSYVYPQLRARGMLRKGATCLADRFWIWTASAEEFEGLGVNDAALLKARVDEGVARIAMAMADDLFLSDRRRISLFPEGKGPATARPLMIARPDQSRGLASWEAKVEGVKPCTPSSAGDKPS